MEFPDTIEGFGYEFSEDGKLQKKDTGEPFEFEVKKENHSYNQDHYDALGELITPYVYSLLEDRCKLKRFPVPVDAEETEPGTFIFCSEGFAEAEKILVFIHGSGVVRAGQWARRLIINDSLNSGTQIPFIERGQKEGYGIIVMNTNDNFVQGPKAKIRGSESPVDHGRYVWENYIRKCSAKKIAVIAHSFGGVVTTRLYEQYKKDFKERVFAVALTDSVHFTVADISGLIKIGRNWVTSSLELDEPVSRRGKDIPCVSAGCRQHEMTSWYSFESIFKFLYEKLLPVAELEKCMEKLPSSAFANSISIDEEKTDKQCMEKLPSAAFAHSISIDEEKTDKQCMEKLPTVAFAHSISLDEEETDKQEKSEVPDSSSKDCEDSTSRKLSDTDENEDSLMKKLKCAKSL